MIKMYVKPNSDIYLLRGIPLDNRYEHTLWFGDTKSQHNYFAGKVKHHFTDVTYTGKDDFVTVNITADNCYDCNYLMYQNKAFGRKWFYAFIKKVEYVSNDVTRIFYEIDIMQTWLRDYKMGECFVEREHVTNDAIGSNTIPEPISFGEEHYKKTAITGDYLLSDKWSIAIGFKKSIGEGGKVSPSIVAGVPCGTDVYIFNSWDTFKTFFRELSSESVGAVAFITTMPRELGVSIGGGRVTSNDGQPYTKVIDIPRSIFTTKPGKYTPVNNKCYVYPYNYLEVQSAGETYRYQLEKNKGAFTFAYDMAFSANPAVFVRCTSYSDQNNGFTFSAYPQLPWSGQIYSQWQIAKNVNQLNMIKGMTASHSLTTLGGSLLNSLYNNAITDDTYTRIAPSTNGASGDYSGIVSKRLRPLFARAHLTDNALRSLDNYFTRFGYQVNRLKTPTRHTRPSFNYVKTLGCTITGSLPADDMQRINAIHDRGVTYWSNHSAVGDYSVNNK